MIFPSPESPIPSPRISGKLRGVNTPTALHIVPVTDRRGLDDFIEVPFSIYRNDPNWVPPLRFERREALARTQPLSEHAQWQLWVAYRDDKPIGRISAQVDQLHLNQHHDQTGFFGFLEAPDDPAVFNALFATAEAWLREHGVSRVRGPFSLNINQERSEEHTSELQSLMRISYAVFCLKKKKHRHTQTNKKMSS